MQNFISKISGGKHILPPLFWVKFEVRKWSRKKRGSVNVLDSGIIDPYGPRVISLDKICLIATANSIFSNYYANLII